MAKTRTKGVKQSVNWGTVAVAGAALGGLYLITKPGHASPSPTPEYVPSPYPVPGPEKTTWLQDLTRTIVVNPAAQIVTGVAEVPGQIIIGVPKKMITASEERTSTEVFGGVARTGVSSFLATAPSGSVFAQPVTYKEFIKEQPIAFRVAAGTGNIISGQEAAKYGAYVAEETKKGQAVYGRPEGEYAARFAQLPAWQQVLVGLGQAVTVPLGGGGASGWGARATTPAGTETFKKVVTAPFAGLWGLFGPSYA